MHTEVPETPLIFFLPETSWFLVCFFFCCKENLSSHFSILFFPVFFPLCQAWFLLLFKVLVSRNTGVSKWPLHLQWSYPYQAKPPHPRCVVDTPPALPRLRCRCSVSPPALWRSLVARGGLRSCLGLSASLPCPLPGAGCSLRGNGQKHWAVINPLFQMLMKTSWTSKLLDT